MEIPLPKAVTAGGYFRAVFHDTAALAELF